MVGRALRLVAVVGGEAGAVAVLQGLGRVDGLGGPGADPVGWLRSATPEEVVAGTLRLVALGCAWWLLASTVLYVGLRLARPRAGVVGPARLVPPAVRRHVDRALAVSMMASAALGGGLSGVAAAGEPVAPPPTTIAVRDGRAVATAPPEPPTTPATVPPTTAPPAPDPPPAPAESTPRVHVVAPGESLWTIAARHAGAATEPDLARYWARVVEANRATLRSGNPDLIYPGEVVELPPPHVP